MLPPGRAPRRREGGEWRWHLGVLLVALCGCQTQDAYVGWMTSTVDLDQVDARPSGPVLGWQGSNGGAAAGFIELQLPEDDDERLDLVALNMGVRTRPAVVGIFEMRGQADIGLVRADLERLQNENSLVTLGLGLQPALRLHDAVSIVALAGYRFYFDATEPTTCRDGTTSSSVGSGTCSHHGGIAHYNEQIGDGGGPELLVGLRVSF